MTLAFTEGEMVALPAIAIQQELSLPAAKTALIVVDMQNDFVSEGGTLVVPGASATVSAISDLLMQARAAGVRIAYTQDTHLSGDKEFAIWPEHCLHGTWGWQIVDALTPQQDAEIGNRASEIVAQKSRYDGFYGSQLDHYLTRVWQVEHLVIVGTVASICVLHTAASAGLRWFHVVAPVDGLSALTDFDMALTLRQISSLYTGHVVATGAGINFA